MADEMRGRDAERFDEGDRVVGEVADRVGIGALALAVPALVEREQLKLPGKRREQQFETAPGIGQAVQQDDVGAGGADRHMMVRDGRCSAGFRDGSAKRRRRRPCGSLHVRGIIG